MVSPVEVISETFFACTWVRKNVYEPAVRAGGASRNDEMTQFSASRTSSIQPQRSQTGRRFGVSPPPPGGAPSTRHGGDGWRSSPVRFGGLTRVSGPPLPSGAGVVMSRRYLSRVIASPHRD